MGKRAQLGLEILLLVAALVAGVVVWDFTRGAAPPAPRATSPSPAAPPAATAGGQSAPAPARNGVGGMNPAPTAPAGPGGLTEERFVDLATTIILSVVQMGERPDLQELMPGLVEKTLSGAGVKVADYEAYQRQISGDPPRAERVAQAIVDRVEQRATPQMRMRALSLAEGFRLQQGGQQRAKPAPPKPKR